jgi:hypothetical protein
MTRAQALALTVARANAAVEQQLENAEIDLLDQGATPEHVADELRSLRRLFEAHAGREIAAVAAWLSGDSGDTLH